MNKLGLIWLVLYSLNASALQERFRPYQLGSVYNLNRYLPWEGEAPEIVNYPTGCSVNTLTDFALQSFFPESRGPYSRVFHSECVRHDLCYRHGYYTYQFTKDDCDGEFSEGLKNRCTQTFQGTERIQCQRIAEVLILAARKFGHLSYHADDYSIRDYGYYFEYLDNRLGQYALLWSLLDAKSEHSRTLYRRKINSNLPLPPRQLLDRLLEDFFKKRIGLNRLMSRMRSLSNK